jgi:hypothetical protein
MDPHENGSRDLESAKGGRRAITRIERSRGQSKGIGQGKMLNPGGLQGPA